jgi:DNA-binding response OmpR family regulator
MSVRVLIAEPDRSLLVNYEEFLTHEGFEVAQATNGLECIARLREFGPDVLVLEPDLPWGWGDGVLAVMGEQKDVPWVPVIIVTAGRYPLADDAAFPIRDVCAKPFPAPKLAERIRRLMNHASRAASGTKEERDDGQHKRNSRARRGLFAGA